MRIFVQASSLLLFTALFYLATYKLPDWLPADVYLRLDPLLGLTAILAGKEIIGRTLWSLMIVGTTLVIGRFFCGYVCPMGVVIDFSHSLIWGRQKISPLKNETIFRKTKYFLLFAFLIAALAGISLSYFMDPLPLLTRFYTFVLYPLAITLINFFLDLMRPIFHALGWIGLSHRHYSQPVYYMAIVTFLILAAIITLSRLTPRFWCRYLCPLGALLSFISPLGLWKRRVSQECNECLKCQKACPMGAVEENPKRTHLAECIQCRTCAEVCPQEAITFPASFAATKASGHPTSAKGGEYSAIDFSRRGFFYSAAGGLTLAFLADRTPFTPLKGRYQLIRPPGALPETDFLQTCIRCGECMKSCITNTLQPCFWESGLAGFWTPKMDLRFAPCEQNCNVCGKVCPTQAIRSLPLEEKTNAKVGTAVLRKEMCLVWAQDKLCLICDEICPYNAIVFRTVEGYRRPFVIASRCNGCGFCEQRCPIQGDSAIIVVPSGEIRLKEGSYIKEAQKLQLEFKPDPGDDKFILEESGFKVNGGKKEGEKILPQEKTLAPKPKGFL
ncbi:MAG: 4Fe-4S binding protein [Deltaproteobacteria bacterium]|nr:4Fe-4S binding protein [Deltaproteobacteria bacterium]